MTISINNAEFAQYMAENNLTQIFGNLTFGDERLQLPAGMESEVQTLHVVTERYARNGKDFKAGDEKKGYDVQYITAATVTAATAKIKAEEKARNEAEERGDVTLNAYGNIDHLPHGWTFSPKDFTENEKAIAACRKVQVKKGFTEICGKWQPDLQTAYLIIDLTNPSAEAISNFETEQKLEEARTAYRATLSTCREVVDGKECGREYDAQKYDCCYQCHMRKYAARHGVAAAKKHFM